MTVSFPLDLAQVWHGQDVPEGAMSFVDFVIGPMSPPISTVLGGSGPGEIGKLVICGVSVWEVSCD